MLTCIVVFGLSPGLGHPDEQHGCVRRSVRRAEHDDSVRFYLGHVDSSVVHIRLLCRLARGEEVRQRDGEGITHGRYAQRARPSRDLKLVLLICFHFAILYPGIATRGNNSNRGA